MPEELPADIQLQPSTHGWLADVPSDRGSFFGHPIRLRINTRNAPNETPPRSPNAIETALAMQVLGDLPRLLPEAERQFITYHARYEPDAQSLIHDPHIWIDHEFIEGGTQWTFVVGSTAAPDYGLHIEFDGSKCVDVWGGD